MKKFITSLFVVISMWTVQIAAPILYSPQVRAEGETYSKEVGANRSDAVAGTMHSLNIVTVLASSLVAATAYKTIKLGQCGASRWMFTAAGAAFSVATVMNWFSYVEQTKRTETVVNSSDKLGDNIQAVIAGRQVTEGAFKFLDDQALYSKYYASALTVITAISALELAFPTSLISTCGTTPVSYLDNENNSSDLIAKVDSKQSASLSSFLYASQERELQFMDSKYSPTLSELSWVSEISKKTSEMVMDGIAPKAEAGVGMGVTAGIAAAVGPLSWLIAPLRAPVEFAMQSAISRSIFFGSLAATTWLVYGYYDVARSKVRRELNVYNELEAQARIWEATRNPLSASGKVAYEIGSVSPGKIELGNPTNLDLSLCTNSRGELDSGCSCLQSSTCLKIPPTSSVMGNSSFANLPKDLSTIASTTVTAGSQLANGQTAAGLSTFSSGGKQNVARIKAIKKESDKKISDYLKSKGIKNTLSELEKGSMEKFQADVQKAIATLSPAQQSMLNKMTSTAEIKPESVKKSDEAVKRFEGKIASKGGTTATPTANPLDGLFLPSEVKDQPVTAEANKVQTSGANLEFEEVVPADDGRTIFQMVSGRYIKSAFPRFFEEEKK